MKISKDLPARIFVYRTHLVVRLRSTTSSNTRMGAQRSRDLRDAYCSAKPFDSLRLEVASFERLAEFVPKFLVYRRKQRLCLGTQIFDRFKHRYALEPLIDRAPRTPQRVPSSMVGPTDDSSNAYKPHETDCSLPRRTPRSSNAGLAGRTWEAQRFVLLAGHYNARANLKVPVVDTMRNLMYHSESLHG